MLAGIYCRASSDPRERGLSVETQEEDGRRWCDQNGHTVAWVIVDNNYSASQWASKARPGYQQVQRHLAGDAPVEILVARDSSRLQRDLVVYVQVRDLCERYGVLWAYNGRTYDLARTDDRFSTGLDALLAERRASEIRDDVVLAVDKRVRAGKPHGRVAYGYQPVYDPHTGSPTGRIPDPGPAAIVKEIASRLLSGRDTIYSLASDLDRRGVPAPEAIRRWRRGIEGPSTPWRHRLVRDIATNPTYAGLRTHNGKVTGPGLWEPLITEDDHHELVALMRDPKRLTHRDHRVKHLLSGIARCGVCGAPVGAIVNRGAPSYGCKGNGQTWRGTRHVVRRQHFVDAYVEETLLAALERPDFADLFGDPADRGDDREDAQVELAVLEARLEEFRVSAENPDGISAQTLARMEAKYEPLIKAARMRLVPTRLPEVAQEARSVPDVRAWWPRQPLENRRLLVRTLLSVTIEKSPHPRGAKGFDPSLVRIEWRR